MPFGGFNPKVFDFKGLDGIANELWEGALLVDVKVFFELCFAIAYFFLIDGEGIPQSIKLIIHKD